MATVQEIYNEIDRIDNAKSGIAGAIEEKGVEVPAGAKIDEYPELVRQIQQGGSSDVFVAEYGTTTYADIAAAYAAGKVCLADKGDNDYVYVLTYITATTARFTCARENGHYEVRCSSGNVWQTATYNLQSTDNRVSTLSGNETNTTKYPNTKAVVDYVNDIVGDIETLLAAI